jgi:hypothetical protein
LSFLGFEITVSTFTDRFRIFSAISATLPFRHHWIDLDTSENVAVFNGQPKEVGEAVRESNPVQLPRLIEGQ